MGWGWKWMCCVAVLKLLYHRSHCDVSEGNVRNGRQKATEEFSYFEKVVPVIRTRRSARDAVTWAENQHLDEVEVVVEAFNKTFTLDLKLNKNLFGDKFVEKHTTNGKPVVRRYKDHKNHHCFYHGKIRHEEESLIALSTCDGLSGLFQDGTEQYYIQPVAGSTGFHHHVFRASDRHEQHLRCGTGDHAHDFPSFYHSSLNSKHLHRLRRAIRGPYNSGKKTRYVELFLVSDHRQFDMHGKNVAKVIQRSKEIGNIVSALYNELDIYVALVGVEVWDSGDKIIVDQDADVTLNNFLSYRKTFLNPHFPNDNGQLITGQSFKDGIVGKALKRPICTYRYSGGVNTDHSELPGPVGTTVAHEMGHNFGMTHDNLSVCKCPEQRCIMAATTGSGNPTKWSSCSKKELQEAFDIGMDYCLRNKPTRLFGSPTCGNGFVEDGEQCDCGLPEECKNKCCNASSCTLMTNATCATGTCCNLQTCQMKPMATECRPVAGECDLPEFCSGNSEDCPADVFVQNGRSCKSGQSYCYQGKCTTHDAQCKLLWGSTGQVSPPVCYTRLNTRGSEFGNCGYSWIHDNYTACKQEDTMCGMLHCQHQNEKLMFWREALSRLLPYTTLDVNGVRIKCKSAILDVGLNDLDPGMTPDGAKCGEDKLCVNQTCMSFDQLGVAPCPEDCNQNGICNSNNNCHCEVGLAPPLCNTPGYGGSVDSGPASSNKDSIVTSTVAQSTESSDTAIRPTEIPPQGDNSLMIGLLIFFLLIVPLLVIGGFFAYRYREQLKVWWGQKASAAYKYKDAAPPKSSRRSESSVKSPSKPRPPPSIAAVEAQSVQERPPPPPAPVPKDPVNRQPSTGSAKMPISNPVLQSTTNRTPSFKDAKFIEKPRVIVRPTVYANLPDSENSDEDSGYVTGGKPARPPKPWSENSDQSSANQNQPPPRPSVPPVKFQPPPNRPSQLTRPNQLPTKPLKPPTRQQQPLKPPSLPQAQSKPVPLRPAPPAPLSPIADTDASESPSEPQVGIVSAMKQKFKFDNSNNNNSNTDLDSDPLYEPPPKPWTDQSTGENIYEVIPGDEEAPLNGRSKAPEKPSRSVKPMFQPRARPASVQFRSQPQTLTEFKPRPVSAREPEVSRGVSVKDRIAKLSQENSEGSGPAKPVQRSKSGVAKPSIPPKPRKRPDSVAQC
ncbi:disintegrin and metalloproteinase domain-containing protein 9 isoform X1 [Lingula anatina]|uniref:Disintegrin and metalloproteinase domain-containing protein 9 isoform X1 n=1 Tax=Lingula anatina TaxID=7574 RepID=A0A1S3IW11_LINAN|nr:disintegrin and metalloproteinase domain-containing protein 9 isoform X1 [Lingula anatina]|eukprot:XP_013402377.1 disintegrin and metalloproteinase domain-containing protein 9 isoform X1 [Lingula anatina]